MSEVVIRTDGLTKYYGKFRAVHNLNIEVKKGQTYGFLGPNGAGKSTTIKMLTGFLKPSSGFIEINGRDMSGNQMKVRERMGIVPDQFGFYPLLTADEHLGFYGKLYGMDQAKIDKQREKLIPMVGLEERRDAKLGQYSHGMKQRLAIAQALLNDPDLLFLDEPTTGLDPQGSYETRELIKKLARGGLTIFVSSHLLYEVEDVCSHAGIIKNGELIVEDTIKNIQQKSSKSKDVKLYAVLDKEGNLEEVLGPLSGVEGVEPGTEKGYYILIRKREDIPKVARTIANSELGLVSIYEQQSSLEQIFLELTGGGPR